MTTNSYPAVGTGGMTEVQWNILYGGNDGIVEDYATTTATAACAVTYVDGTNTANINVGKVAVNGYLLDITATHPLVLAAAVSTPITYYIAAQYDPALNVAQGDLTRSVLGPCRLIVGTTLDTAGGKAYTLLYTVTRTASQLLSNATVVDYRRWIGRTVIMGDYPGTVPIGFGPFPRGSVMIQTAANPDQDTNKISVVTLNAAGTAATWQSVNSPDAIDIPHSSLLIPAGYPPLMHKFSGSMVALRGTLARSSGANLSTGTTVTVGSLPAGWRPGGTQRFPCIAQGGPAGEQTVSVLVGVDGAVSMRDPQYPCLWVDLSGIIYRAEN